jgi:PAS domain S-box-containing protein
MQHHLETKILRENNEMIDVDISISVLKNHEGKVIGSIGVIEDITDRKQMEKALETSEEKFKQLYEKAPVPYHTISPRGEITSVNEKWCRTLGYKKKEVINRSIFKFIAEKEREIAKSSFKEKIRCKKSYTGGHERTFITKDGVKKIFLIHDFLLSDKDNNAISIHTTMEDVTEQKMIEERSRQETEDIELINSLNNAVNQGNSLLEIFRLLEDETRRIFSSNGATVYLLSTDKKELVPQLTSYPKKLLNKDKKLTGLKISTPRIVLNKDNIYTKILADKKPRLTNNVKDIKKMIVGCTEKRMMKSFIPRIYSLLDIHSVISVPLVSFHEVIGLLDISCKEPFSGSDVYRIEAIAEQITAIVKKKITDDMLKESEDRYRDLFENVKDLIQSVNAEGKFVYANRSWLKTLGYSKDEVKNLNLSDIIREDYIPHCMEVFKRVCAGETVNNVEVVFVAKDGQEIYVEGNANAHFQDGKFIATRSIFRDITLRKQAEEQLKQLNQNLELKVQKRTVEVENLLKQKDEFVNQLNHDLRSPLTPLVNLIPILEKKEKDPKSKELLEILRRNINRMKNIVSKTLKLAELNAPSTMFDLKDINLWETADNSIKDQQIVFDEKDFTVKNKVDENIFVKADKIQLNEVFGNLISNAVKYSPLGGTITVDAHVDGDFVTVSIMDFGDGLTSEQIDYIFNEFYKADESRHDLESSGLGLSICKRIVEKHGGRIWAESPGLGRGSIFCFTIPIGLKINKDDVSEKVKEILDY